MTDTTTVEGVTETHRTWSTSWHVGDALWWREYDGLHGVLLTDEPTFGPKGGRREPGEMVYLLAPSVEAMNEVLADLDFEPMSLAWDVTGVDKQRLADKLGGLRDQLRERREMLEAFARLTGSDSILKRPKPRHGRRWARGGLTGPADTGNDRGSGA